MLRVWNSAGAALWVAALAAVAVSVAGCGGGESPAMQAGAQAAASPLRSAAAPLRTTAAADPFTVTALLDWAPTHYPQLFSRSFFVGTYGPYTYRSYPQTATTSNYLGFDAGNNIWVKLGDGDVFPVGNLSEFECEVVPTHCLVTAPPASDNEAFSGLYTGNSAGPSPYAWVLVAADGSFIGTNSAVDGSRWDIFTGNATVQPGSWSSTAMRYGSYATHTTYATLGSANATGTFAAKTSAAGTLAVSGLNPVGSQLALDYNQKSLAPASLWIGGGSYVYPPYGTNLSIDTTTGAVSGTLQTNCSFTGTMTVPSPNRNVYKMSGTLAGSSCPVTGAIEFFGFYDANSYQQAMFLYGTTPGSQLAFTAVTLYRNS